MDKAYQIKRIEDAVTRLFVEETFLGAVGCRLERVYLTEEDDNPLGVTTAAVDGRYMYWYLPYTATLSKDELFGVAVHEPMHIALGHIYRLGGKDGKLWNIATDAVINRDIFARQYSLPRGAVRFDWVTAEMSAEEVYNRLLQESGEEGGGQPGEGEGEGEEGGGQPGEGKEGGGRPGKPSDTFGSGDLRAPHAEAPSAEEAATIIMAAAKQAAQAAGKGGLLVERIAGGEGMPVVPWQDVLRSFMVGAFDRQDYSYRRANRRFIQDNLYLPSLYSESMGCLVIGVDTSGSISEVVLNQAAAEITAIAEDCRPSKIVVIYCDAQVSHVETFEAGEQIVLHPKGGGGTRFKPVFDWVAANMTEPVAAMIYFTDTYGSMTELEEPGYPVLWGLTESVPRFVPPFGVSVDVWR